MKRSRFCLTVHPGASAIELPVRTPRADDRTLRAFGPPEGAAPTPRRMIEPGHHNWLVHRDLAEDRSTLEVINDNGVYRLEEIDLEVESRTTEWYSSQGDDFLSARGETRAVRGLRRGDWTVRTVTRTVLTSTPEAFHVSADLDAYEGGERVFCRTWNVSLPRDFV